VHTWARFALPILRARTLGESLPVFGEGRVGSRAERAKKSPTPPSPKTGREKIYYVAYRNNAFDTHVYQADVHARLWTYTSDHIAAFMKDVARLGRADDVVLMAFSEFGRRAQENTSQGTDHGTAGPAFIIGQPVNGGQYGKVPSFTDLNRGNLVYTTDFRRVYATAINKRMGYEDPATILKGEGGRAQTKHCHRPA
jgi:uncharacterized protein (DUF1501 family)